MQLATSNSTAISGTMNSRDMTNFKVITKRASDIDLDGIKCHLNDEFGLFIQGILAFVAFSTLLCKSTMLCSCLLVY